MGGNMLEIIGTDFRLPDPVPATGPVPPPVPTVRVSVGGVDASTVLVVSGTRMFAVAPKFSLVAPNGQPLSATVVDVVVTNLDNSGVPIVGETVTAADAYTYGRPDISAENQSDFTRLVRTLLRLLKSEVVQNVTLEIDTDYDEDLNTQRPDHGELPGLSVIGPDVDTNTFYQDFSDVEELEISPGEILIQRRLHTVDLGFDIVGYSDNEVEFLNFLALTEEWKDRNQRILMDCDPGDPSAGQFSYDFQFIPGGQFKVEKQAGLTLDSNLKVFRGSVVIKGFNFTGLPGVVRDKGVGISTEVAEDGVILQDVEQTGTDLPDDLAQARRSPPLKGSC